ncbi:PAQR family membrane homeostasis protein TrhA [Nitrosomonas sp. Is37]|uniref:PAQR family membrane homeostasis protein TrhA n=1 Tax=Nitrosomonas sp. Is37 TaxID=3080535 RepID=UPI00294B4B44|nr:hemolysin III family protein [Nitrosomonas sp. Is37]MDV6343958.1 hemolysin III family protein [Nitrosomonas sp. Is37]
MNILLAVPEREQSRGEEIANSISHGIGLVAALVATPFLIMHAVQHADTGFILGASLFVATMVLLYLASTLYHALPRGKAKRVFKIIEHSAIFLLIAGTYTPFMLGVLRDAWGWILLVIVWSLAAIGVVLKAFDKMHNPIISVSFYLLMGWLILISIYPLYTRIPASGLLWLVAGGVAYTVGVFFFMIDSRLRYGHFIWHLFVMVGTSCHYVAVLWYAVS